MPLQRLASDIAVRASRLAGSRITIGNAAAARRMPSTHSASVIGFARLDTYGSISCVMASMPLAAVCAAGSVNVRSGSTMATRGSMKAWRRLTLTRSAGDPSTALRVTSLPVPAVVGIVMHGRDGCVSGWPRPTTSR